jgi:sugar/nucleoside kinase (ribokinase family)
MTRLVHVGAVIADVVLDVPRLPEHGGDVLATTSTITAGGGFNVLTAAARDGMDVLWAGLRGTGPFGDVVATGLAAEGIVAALDPLPDQDSGYCVVLVDATGERTFVTSFGAETRLDAERLDAVELRPDDLVYLSGYTLAVPSSASLVGWVEALPASVRLVLDPASLVADLDPGLLDRVLRRTDLLSLNAREAHVLTGRDDPAEASASLLGRIADGGAVVLRDGAAGTHVRDASGLRHHPAHPVEAVDTTGAGDAHTGVTMAAVGRGLGLDDAVRRANVAAALAVTRRGPATSPRASVIDAALATGQDEAQPSPEENP